MSFSPTNPGDLFGGTWEQIRGRFLLAVSEEYPVDSTGGEATHTMTIAEMPSHNHYVKYTWAGTGSTVTSIHSNINSSNPNINTSNTGGNQPHNNMPPYLAVYMWRRVG